MSPISSLLHGRIVILLLASCGKNIAALGLKVSGTNLLFPSGSTKSIYTSIGRYIPKNVIATRLQIYKDNAFVALPRYRQGVPYTVARFNLSSGCSKARLEPYPSWSIQEEGNCEAFQNAIDLVVDPVERMWILDLGICNTLEQPVKRCDPKVWCLNLITSELVKAVNLKLFVTAESRLQYLQVDYNSSGTPFLYVSDAGTGALIVINVITGSGYRLLLPSVVVPPDGAKDILYLQLARNSSENTLYFTYLGSPRLFSIKSVYLQHDSPTGAILDVGTKPAGAQMVLLGTDNGLAIFFRYKGESDIYVWHSDTGFKKENFALVQSGGDCRMATQVVPGQQHMWAIESNFRDFITNSTGCLGASVHVYPLGRSSD
ncbi:major royal jelly protein 1-like [Dendroctonus ponderosae]|nr:major royal jelly protein 1 [Dendroctonus ponderosae]XP_048519829.1 major royal jelly protein 1-like [Dendroctonus ponderosae]XP_048521413.1 major royal jelly protein 1-like [Dendroctonus ponderosae]